MELTLKQRGRASIEFAASLARATGQASRDLRSWLQTQGLDDDVLSDNLDDRLAQVEDILVDSTLYPAATLCDDWLWANHGKLSIAGFEEILPDIKETLDQLDEGPATLTTKQGFELPKYFSKQWFHNTHGGWDGHEYMGTIQSEFVHKRYVTAKYGANVYELRRRLLEVLPQRPFERILEMGTSAGYFTVEIANKFPQAEIHGCDLSKRMLEHAKRVANSRGEAWNLLLAPAEDTGLPAESFDLVTSYALFHELPKKIIEAVWREAYRLVRPGGYALMADGVPHFDSIDRLASWRLCHDWLRGGEPYARGYCQLDDAAAATAAGFVDVQHKQLGNNVAPRFTIAQKPL